MRQGETEKREKRGGKGKSWFDGLRKGEEERE